jgi:hypothetical protein
LRYYREDGRATRDSLSDERDRDEEVGESSNAIQKTPVNPEGFVHEGDLEAKTGHESLRSRYIGLRFAEEKDKPSQHVLARREGEGEGTHVKRVLDFLGALAGVIVASVGQKLSTEGASEKPHQLSHRLGRVPSNRNLTDSSARQEGKGRSVSGLYVDELNGTEIIEPHRKVKFREIIQRSRHRRKEEHSSVRREEDFGRHDSRRDPLQRKIRSFALVRPLRLAIGCDSSPDKDVVGSGVGDLEDTVVRQTEVRDVDHSKLTKEKEDQR